MQTSCCTLEYFAGSFYSAHIHVQKATVEVEGVANSTKVAVLFHFHNIDGIWILLCVGVCAFFLGTTLKLDNKNIAL